MFENIFSYRISIQTINKMEKIPHFSIEFFFQIFLLSQRGILSLLSLFIHHVELHILILKFSVFYIIIFCKLIVY